MVCRPIVPLILGSPVPSTPVCPWAGSFSHFSQTNPIPAISASPSPGWDGTFFISLGQQAPHSCSSGVGRQLPVSHTSVCCVGKSLLPSWGWTSARGSVGRQDGRSGEAVSSWEFALLSLYFFFNFSFWGAILNHQDAIFVFLQLREVSAAS